MSAYGNIESALQGMLFGMDYRADTRIAGNDAEFGTPAVVYAGDSEKAFQYLLDKSILTFDADFVASNVIVVTVNGVASASVTYATSHAATFAAVIAAVNAISGVSAVAGTGRQIVIITEGAVATVSASVTAGSSQAGSSQVLSCSASVFGVFPRTQKLEGKYLEKENANVLRSGEIWVMTADAVVANTAAYIVAATGVWTDSSSGNVSTNYVFRSSTDGAGLARLEVK
jgi:hypothetical protein